MELTPILIKNKVFNRIVLIVINFVCLLVRKINSLKPNKSGNIVIIALHKLGDSILGAYAIKEIEKHYKVNVSLVCFDEIYDVYSIIFKKINLITLSRSDFYFEQRFARKRARKIVNYLKPEIIIDLTGSIASASLIFSSRGEKIIGINNFLFRKLYDVYVPIRSKPHLVDIYLDVVKRIVPTNEGLKNLIHEQYLSNRYIMIHPFAGWAAKEWNFKKFIELAEFLNGRIECIIVFPSEKMKLDIVNELENKKIKYFETKTMVDLIKITEHCLAFIGNDSGPLHLANLFGKPTFSIYGPSNPDYHLPVLGINEYAIKKVVCSPKEGEKLCFTNGGRNGCPSFECMNYLSVREVSKKILNFIERIA